jgi:hypothetical protein
MLAPHGWTLSEDALAFAVWVAIRSIRAGDILRTRGSIMTRISTRVLAILSLSFAALAAHAEAEKGVYAGAGVGQFNLEIDNLDDAQDALSDFDSDDTSWKVFAGYRFSPNFAFELDYIDFGGPEDQGVTVDVSGLAPYLIATIPLGIFEISGHLGYYFYDFDVDVSDASFSDSDEDLVYGASVAVILGQRFDLRLMYEIIDISDVDDANALWLSGAFRF